MAAGFQQSSKDLFLCSTKNRNLLGNSVFVFIFERAFSLRQYCEVSVVQCGYLSCIFSRMGTIMSNLGLFAGSSFMQIFMSLQM